MLFTISRVMEKKHLEIENMRLFQVVQRELAERQELVEELARSNRDLDDFAYIASHDLQEPLRKIIVFGDRFIDRYADVLDEKGRDYVHRMISAAERMKLLIMGLLQYSRGTTRKKVIEPVDLNEVVKDVVSDLAVRIEDSGAIVEVADLPQGYLSR